MGSLAGLYPQMSTVYGGQKGAIHESHKAYELNLVVQELKFLKYVLEELKQILVMLHLKIKLKQKNLCPVYTS